MVEALEWFGDWLRGRFFAYLYITISSPFCNLMGAFLVQYLW